MIPSDPPKVRPELLPLSIARALWKRKLLLLVTWLVACGLTVLVVYQLPAVYHAESLILIEGQRIPERYVPGTVNDQLDNRLSMLTQQIKSYDTLLELTRQFELYREERKTMVEEEIIEKMREDIQVELVKGWDRDESPAFRISYLGTHPQTVARVANEIRERFLRANLKIREDQAVGTSEFLGRQLRAARQNLEQQEARLSEYKKRYNGQLPEQTSTLMAMLNRLQMQLQSVQEGLNQNRQNQLMLENSLATAENSVAAFAGIADQVGSAKTTLSQVPYTTEELHIAELEAQLESLRLRYSEDHPDVQRAASEFESARRLAAVPEIAVPPSDAAGQPSAADPGQATLPAGGGKSAVFLMETLRQQRERAESLRVQLAVNDEERSHLDESRATILAEIGDVQRRIQNLPLREQELAHEIRDYDISRTNYQSLLNKRMEADMAANMEAQQKAERFTVLDVARVPNKPIEPRRELLIAVGCAAGLVLGAALAFGVELNKNVLLGEWELPVETVVLGRIPRLQAAGNPPTKTPALRDSGERQRSQWLRPLVLAPTLLLCLVGGLIATGIYAGWSPF